MVALFLDGRKALEPHQTDGAPVHAREVAWPLFRCLGAADDLVQFVDPDRDPAAYRGVASTMLPPGPPGLRFRHRDHPEWDFKP